MKNILEAVQKRLSEIPELKYIDENWGQLDYYSPNMPVQWPCCLIDLQTAHFENISKDLSKKPKDRQNANINLELSIANLKLSNTSYKTPDLQKNNAWSIFNLVEEIHEKLHGNVLIENCSKLGRSSFGRVIRDDGVQEYKLVYQLSAFNV